MESENLILKDNLSSLHRNYIDLEKEKVDLTLTCQDQKAALVKFTRSKANLERMMGEQKSSLNKNGIGYHRSNPRKPTTTFVKVKGSIHMPTCFYCCKKGHVKSTCPYKRNDPYIIRNTYPLCLTKQVKQIWVL